jgi:glycosyltransferase involved in cell wall biosynthesis
MRIVFITQQVDPNHPALGATVAKIRALAERADRVSVLADGAVVDVLPENCRVRLFGSRWKAGRGLRFEAALAREVRSRPAAVVAHMCPIYAVLAAPIARPLGVRVILWYTHWAASLLLQAAERAANSIISVDRRSFPLRSAKVRAIGHGIDLGEFACGNGAPTRPTVRALALGRYSPAKGLDYVLHGLALARERGTDVRLTAHGPVGNELEQEHRRTLGQLADALELTPYVELGDPVPRERVAGLFRESDLLVNNMRAGAPDKVVYEAGASCLPVVASNPVFDSLLDDSFRFGRERPEELADRLVAFAALRAEERGKIGQELRRRVEEGHSVESWAERVLEVARG